MPRRTISQPHLERRPEGFFWRRRWPQAHLRRRPLAASKNLFLCASLRTQVLSEARILAQRLTALSDQVFAAVAEKTMPIAPDLAETLLVSLVRFRIEAAELMREVAPHRPEEAAAFELAQQRAEQEVLRRALTLRDRTVAREPLREVATQLGLSLDEADPGYQRLAMRALRVLLDIGEENLRRDQGIYAGPAPAFRTALQIDAGHLASSGVAVSPLKSSVGMPLSGAAPFADRYARAARRRGHPDRNSEAAVADRGVRATCRHRRAKGSSRDRRVRHRSRTHGDKMAYSLKQNTSPARWPRPSPSCTCSASVRAMTERQVWAGHVDCVICDPSDWKATFAVAWTYVGSRGCLS